MGRIRTVTGDIEPEFLGFCDIHMHVVVSSEFLCKTQSWELFAVDNYKDILHELNEFCRAGGRALVDAQPVGTGRRGLFMKQLAEDTGLNIIASTGFHQASFYPDDHWIYSWSEEMLADLFTEEIETGMYEYAEAFEPQNKTNVKAGMIKTATKGKYLTDQQKKCMKAAAVASVRTGAPVMIHTEDESLEVSVDFLLQNGVPASSVIAAHTDRRDNLPPSSFHQGYQKNVYICFDTFGADYYSLGEKVQEMAKEVKTGEISKILLGTDPTRKGFRILSGGKGLDYIQRVFLPELRKAGVTREEIEKITIYNPAEALTFYR